jgi:glutamate synthase domain-containing protein 2
MAEYITKENICSLIDKLSIYGAFKWKKEFIEAHVANLEVADVVERSEYEKLEKEYNHYKRLAEQDAELRIKIDKAIEELRKEIEENHLNVVDYADGEWIVKEFVYGAIDRLKEKIVLDK